MPLRVLIADDHPIFSAGVRQLLEQEPRYEVVSRHSDGNSVFERLREGDIDIAVLDISMPGMEGLEVVAAARTEGLSLRFIILTMYDDRAYLDRAKELGVEGYVLKDSATEDFVEAIDTVANGGRFVSPAMEHSRRGDGVDAVDVRSLTDAERTVLRELGENLTSKQIAERLNLSFRTVQNHRANICSKLGLRGANRLLEFALANRHLL
ncbi:MAG: response regulator transcription factor [Myxococcales bacterium]|nr:response regulator transcription factor [Myxococcales bacterium]